MSLIKISSLSKKNLGKKISVSGWVENIRDHGGVIFIDLREGNEILQVVVEPQNKEIFEIFGTLLQTIRKFPGPVISIVSGHAIAGGCLLALACDYRYGMFITSTCFS